MADTVHRSPGSEKKMQQSVKASPPPGTYIIQIPKDQIYRYPPPENARRFESFSRRKSKRICCYRCLRQTVFFVVLLFLLLAATSGILYLIFTSKLPKYSIDKLSISGFNLSSPGRLQSISPEINITLSADNSNRKIGIDYMDLSRINVFYSDVNLCHGTLPIFYQPSENITLFAIVLRGSGVLLSRQARSALMADQRHRNVPLVMKLRAPIKIKIGSVKTWKITVQVSCDVAADNLTTSAEIDSKQCDVRVKPWD